QQVRTGAAQPLDGARRLYCASAKGRAPTGSEAGALRGSLLGGERSAIAGLGGGVALVELGRGEGTAVSGEIADLPGLANERLADDRRPAFVGRALACTAGAAPDDIVTDDAVGGRRGEVGGR